MNRSRLLIAIIMFYFLCTPTFACSDHLIDATLMEPVMSEYLERLRQTDWEGVRPFGSFDGQRIYLTPAFDTLSARQKKQVLELLLLGYGEYRPLMTLMSPEQRRQLRESGGVMLPYSVYTADGRIISLPYNGCNRMLVLTEYERSRLGFLGLETVRTQRYPMSGWQQEEVKKIFWSTVGYDLAGDYWIAWVPESGHFEVDVPNLNHQRVLDKFWQIAPTYYRYTIVNQGTRLYTYFQGKRN